MCFSLIFHYILHQQEENLDVFMEKITTTKESERLMRLPMYYGLKPEDVEKVIETIKNFYK